MPGKYPEYSPFNPKLDNKYPVSKLEIDKKDKDIMTDGKPDWLSVFGDSPAQNMEAEFLIGFIVTNALHAGQWVDIPEPTEDVELESFVARTSIGPVIIEGIRHEYRRGVNKLEGAGLIVRVQDSEGRRFVSPTEKLAQFVGERIGFNQSSI